MTDQPKTNRVLASLRTTIPAVPLLASIFLNILLGSYIAVQVLTAEPQLSAPRGPHRMIAMLSSRLPPKDAEILEEIYRSKESQVLAAQSLAHRSRARIMTLLARADFDADEMRAAVKDISEKRMRVGELFMEIVFETLQRISPETRQNLLANYRTH